MAVPRPEPWWHPVRSDPGIAKGLNIWSHLLAVLTALFGTIALGLLLMSVAWAVEPLSVEVAGGFAALAFVVTFSVMFSWAGHLPGAVVLQIILKRGYGGWAVAMAGGLAVGLVLAALVGGPLAALLGPFLAAIHLAALRWWARVFGRRSSVSA